MKTFHQTIRTIRALVDSGRVKRNYPSHQTSPAPLDKLACYDRLLTRMEALELTPEEWAAAAAEDGGIKIAFSPARIKEELK